MGTGTILREAKEAKAQYDAGTLSPKSSFD
jgi:hypothetical protein